MDGQIIKTTRIEDTTQEIILGDTNQGPVTLYRNHLIDSGFRTDGSYQHASYESQYVLTNGHIRNLATAKFNKITLSYSNLFNWLNKRHAEMKHSENSIVVNNTASQKDSYKVSKDITLQFMTYTSSGGNMLSPLNIAIKEKAVLIVTLKKAKTFDQILSIENQIRNFLSFAITKYISLEDESLLRSGKRKTDSHLPTGVIKKNKQKNETENVISIQMLFSQTDVENYISDILINWFSKYDDLLPIYNLYFNAFYSETIVLDQSFLNAIQALEAYHRRTNRNSVLPKAEYKQMKAKILDSTPEEYKKWLAEELAFSNEPTLRNRINDILSDFSEINQVFIADPNFSLTITRYRNLFTHYDPKKTRKTIDFNDLFKQLNKLQVLLDSCILKELGIPLDQITNLIRRRYIHLFHYLDISS